MGISWNNQVGPVTESAVSGFPLWVSALLEAVLCIQWGALGKKKTVFKSAAVSPEFIYLCPHRCSGYWFFVEAGCKFSVKVEICFLPEKFCFPPAGGEDSCPFCVALGQLLLCCLKNRSRLDLLWYRVCADKTRVSLVWMWFCAAESVPVYHPRAKWDY